MNMKMCEWALFPKHKPTTALCLVKQTFWRVPPFTKWVIPSSSKVIFARPSKRSTAGAPSSGTSGSRCFSLNRLHVKIRKRMWLWNFSTFIDILETAIVSFNTLPVRLFFAKNLQNIFVHAILFPDSWPRRSSQNFRFWPQSSYFEFLVRYFFSPLSSICDNQVLTFFWWVSKSYNSNAVLSFWDPRILNLYNPSKMSSCGNFFMDKKNSVPLLNQIPENDHFASWYWIDRRSFRQNHGSQWSRSNRRSSKQSVTKEMIVLFWAFISSSLTFFLKPIFWMILISAQVIFSSSASKCGTRVFSYGTRTLKINQLFNPISLIHSGTPAGSFEQAYFSVLNFISHQTWFRECVKMQLRNL